MFKFFTILLLCLSAGVASAASSRNLLAACGVPDPVTTYPPLNALLYLSGTTTGTAKYECGPDGKPKQTPTSIDGTFINPEGWEGVVFRNKDGFLQFDLGQYQNDTNGFVNSTVVLDNALAVFEPVPNSLPFGRWSVLSNDGEGPPRGLVPMAYVTRVDTAGGAPGSKGCQPGEIVKSDYEAVYNMYTCDEAYLAPTPAPLLAPVPSVLPPAIAPVAPIIPVVLPPAVAPVPAPAAVPIAAPRPATIAPIPAVRPVAVVPSAAPVSGAIVSSSAKLAVAAASVIVSAAVMLV